MKKPFVLSAGSVLLLILLVVLLRSGPDEPVAAAEASADPEPEFQPMSAARPPVEEAAEAEVISEEVAAVEEDEPIHWTASGMNPEDQPRGYYVQHFKPGELPEGFQLHDVLLTERGFELPPGKEGEPRIGLIESPPIPFAFNSNAIAPMWIDDVPEGTSVLVEIAVSPDGENWGTWHQADVDHDSYGQIREFYPDGSPNPNYGYTPGGNFDWGNLTWKYFRYNIALYSETEKSPAVSSFRGFHQDSTLEEGRLAELKPTGERESANP